MSTFENAIPVVLKHEGGYVFNPADPGGETNFGISMLIIRREKITPQMLGIPDFKVGSMKLMNVQAAKDIYKKLFWDKYDYGRLTDQNVATKIFDCGVNCGPERSHRMAQKAANACGQVLDVDGDLGKLSVAGINACSPALFLQAMKTEMEKYYNTLATQRPTLKQFLWIWLKRAAWVG